MSRCFAAVHVRCLSVSSGDVSMRLLRRKLSSLPGQLHRAASGRRSGLSAAPWVPQLLRELKAKWERARRVTAVSLSGCNLGTTGNWELPVELSSP